MGPHTSIKITTLIPRWKLSSQCAEENQPLWHLMIQNYGWIFCLFLYLFIFLPIMQEFRASRSKKHWLLICPDCSFPLVRHGTCRSLASPPEIAETLQPRGNTPVPVGCRSSRQSPGWSDTIRLYSQLETESCACFKYIDGEEEWAQQYTNSFDGLFNHTNALMDCLILSKFNYLQIFCSFSCYLEKLGTQAMAQTQTSGVA